ncbi:MAG: hypothetical protein LBN05_03545 [Oscillospiraceae bacterium]|jgi:hypothetical protein|nr:hypothetical protein [Oscillospiraceae bacterium]
MGSQKTGGSGMVKGVSRQVLELNAPPCVYFERVLFFVKPEYSATSEGTLRERARYIAQSAGLPPTQRIRQTKRRKWLAVCASVLGGALLGAGVMLFLVTHI